MSRSFNSLVDMHQGLSMAIEHMIGESCYINPEAKGHYDGCMETYLGIRKELEVELLKSGHRCKCWGPASEIGGCDVCHKTTWLENEDAVAAKASVVDQVGMIRAIRTLLNERVGSDVATLKLAKDIWLTVRDRL